MLCSIKESRVIGLVQNKTSLSTETTGLSPSIIFHALMLREDINVYLQCHLKHIQGNVGTIIPNVQTKCFQLIATLH